MNQNIVKGVEQILPVLEKRKFLLVRGGAYNKLHIKEIFDTLPHVEFSEVTPNPLYEQVCKGVDLFNRERCEVIVAIGGGSTIDVAKCIKLYCKMDSSINYLKQETYDSGIPLIAVPTTAGSGSESTCHAVIYYEGVKQSIFHTSIIPDYAVLEPSVLKTLPVYQKKCTMLDALSQAIESWWSVNSTDKSKELSRKAIRVIKENWEDYIFKNTDIAGKKIMDGANYAGQAINITATTAAHAMSYKLTAMYQLPHGHAVALCLPQVWEYMLDHTDDCVDSRGKNYFKSTLDQITALIDLDYFKFMLEKLEIFKPAALDKKSEIDILARSVNSVRLRNNPVALSLEVLKNMYERIVK